MFIHCPLHKKNLIGRVIHFPHIHYCFTHKSILLSRNIESRMKELDRAHHPNTMVAINKQEKEEKEQQGVTEEYYPFYKKLLQKREPILRDMGQEALQRSFDFVGRFFAKQDDNVKVFEERPLPPRPVIPQHHDEKPPPLPPRPMDFDQHLKTIENMFPNVESNVCFIILQASNGNVTQAIDR